MMAKQRKRNKERKTNKAIMNYQYQDLPVIEIKENMREIFIYFFFFFWGGGGGGGPSPSTFLKVWHIWLKHIELKSKYFLKSLAYLTEAYWTVGFKWDILNFRGTKTGDKKIK